jgi:hypothetical protein
MARAHGWRGGAISRKRDALRLGQGIHARRTGGDATRAGSDRRIRRDRHRRRYFRHVHALPPARTGHDGTCVRVRHQCRRYLVLEPLSRRPLRFRKLDLRLLVFRGTSAGMGLEGAFLPTARHARIPQPRRRQVRPAPGHAIPQYGQGGAMGRGGQSMDRDLGRWRAGAGAVPDHRDRHPLGVHPAGHSGPGELPRPSLSPGALAAHAG